MKTGNRIIQTGNGIFWMPNVLGPLFYRNEQFLRILLGPTFYSDPNFFWPNFFLTKNFFWPKFFWPKIFLTKNCFWKNIFFDTKVFDQKLLFDQKNLTKNFIWPKSSALTNNFLTENYFWHFFLTKIFGIHFQQPKLSNYNLNGFWHNWN